MAKTKPTSDGITPAKKSPQPKSAPAVDQPSQVPEALEVNPAFADLLPRRRVPRLIRWAGWAVLFVVGLFIAVSVAYAGKALPGVSVDGAKISGLSRDAAIIMVNQHLADFSGTLVPVNYGNQTAQFSVDKLSVRYNVPKAVDLAIGYGHSGSIRHRLYEEFRSLIGRPTNVTINQFDDSALTADLDPIDTATLAPVTNASFNFSGSSVTIDAAAPGHRLNLGYLVLMVEDRIAQASNDPITAPISVVAPTIDTASLSGVKARVAAYASDPLTLNLSTGGTMTVPQSAIISWIKLSRAVPKDFTVTHNVADLYPLAQPVTVSLDSAAVGTYVAALASQLDQPGQNAVLAWENNALSVVSPSQTGQALDQAAAVTDITAALGKTAAERSVNVNIKVSQPAVNENDLASLGIKDLISEGATTFPGSSYARINNIKLGAALYNDVLIKPGDTFSFNHYFINVDAAHGWLPGLAIVGTQIVPIYGGGICQVSSTMYRAALLAGLPITQRTNHAYAISWYTQPYGVPGVDATVYNPGVDLQFKNDTGAYILIQTLLDVPHNSLKFDFYGTKTKTGQIRGPYFDSGSNDVTQPSTTTFYRDILDLSGKVIETDPVTTHYASSLDFKEATLD